MQYRPLYKLDIRHDYYDSGLCPDFTLVPTAECAQLLRNLRMIVKYNSSGLVLLIPVREAEVEENGNKLIRFVPFLPMPADARFQFLMKNENPDFAAITDLEETYGQKTVANPVFSNEESGEDGQLQVQELNSEQTDVFVISEENGETETSQIILKHNPLLRQYPQLNITVPLATDAVTLFNNLPADFVNEFDKPPHFELTSIGSGTDDISTAEQEMELKKPFRLLLAGDENNGISITYQGVSTRPAVLIEEKFQFNGTVEFATFLFNDANGEFSIHYRRPGNNRTRTWAQVLEDWEKFVSENDNFGFHFQMLGNGGAIRMSPNDEPKPLMLQDNLETILPGGGINGLKISYGGSAARAKIKMSVADAISIKMAEEITFKLQPEAVTASYDKASNTVLLSGAKPGQKIQISYPIRPALPWRTFGLIDIVPQPSDLDFTANSTGINLHIAFKAKTFYWKYYIASELIFGETDMVLFINDVPSAVTDSEQTGESLFFLQDITGNTEASIERIGQNTSLDENEKKRLLTQVHAIENSLTADAALNLNGKIRRLLISKEKFPLQKSYTRRLKLSFNKADADTDPDPTFIGDFELSLPLAPPKKDALQLVFIRQPQFEKDFVEGQIL